MDSRQQPPTIDAPESPNVWEFEATIEQIVPGGFALAHDASRTVFVEGAAPGDRARLRVERVRGGLGFARVVEVLEASPVRVDPAHPDFARCGGLDFQHLTYPAQLDAKVGIVADCLRRIAKLEAPPEIPITPSPRQWGYRTRAEWQVDPGREILGYFEHGSRRVCAIEHDPIVVPALDAVLADANRRLATGDLPKTTEVRAVAGDDGVSTSPSLDGGEVETVVRTVGGERYAHDAECFFQANPDLLEPLIAEALRFAPDDPTSIDDRPAIELYCGVGLFTLPLARRFGRVVGVEAHRPAAEFAIRNAATAGLRNVRIEPVAVSTFLLDGWRSFGRPPLLLLDPPRNGLDPRAMPGLLRLRPDRIAYVSCDPATLARDLKGLVAGGYRLDAVSAFDMLPQTHHVEVVAHLERAP